MPFIHIRAHSGRDLETKKKVAQAMVKAGCEVMGLNETSFTVAYEEIERDDWDKDVEIPIIKPLGNKILISHGKPVPV